MAGWNDKFALIFFFLSYESRGIHKSESSIAKSRNCTPICRRAHFQRHQAGSRITKIRCWRLRSIYWNAFHARSASVCLPCPREIPIVSLVPRQVRGNVTRKSRPWKRENFYLLVSPCVAFPILSARILFIAIFNCRVRRWGHRYPMYNYLCGNRFDDIYLLRDSTYDV